MAKRKSETVTVAGLIPGKIHLQVPKAGRRTEIHSTDKTQTIYANNASIEVSSWDVKIRLGQIESVTQDLVTVSEIASVFMSHSHAKAFSDALANVLTRIDAVREASKKGD